jgi:hypothetical protein
MVTPRWLREHRRARARAARDAVAAVIADEVVARTSPSREMTFTELMRAQGVKPFGSEESRSDDLRPTVEEWAAFRTALAEGRRR